MKIYHVTDADIYEELSARSSTSCGGVQRPAERNGDKILPG